MATGGKWSKEKGQWIPGPITEAQKKALIKLSAGNFPKRKSGNLITGVHVSTLVNLSHSGLINVEHIYIGGIVTPDFTITDKGRALLGELGVRISRQEFDDASIAQSEYLQGLARLEEEERMRTAGEMEHFPYKDNPPNPGAAQWGQVEASRARVMEQLRDIQIELSLEPGEIPHLNLSKRLHYGKTQYTDSVTMFSLGNSKMSCASWSLPAARPAFGGSCMAEALSDQDKTGLFVCDICYAGKGTMVNDNVQAGYVVKMEWVKGMIAVDKTGDHFAEVLKASLAHLFENMPERIQRKFIPSYRGAEGKPVTRLITRPGQFSRYFRVHDSGDFFSLPYVNAWIKVAAEFPQVRFWAPTRMWVFPQYVSAFQNASDNFVIRPSALVIDSQPPVVDGMAPGSGVNAPLVTETGEEILRGPYPISDWPENTWICPAYRAGGLVYTDHRYESASCENQHCRVCWSPNLPVTYTEH